MNFFKGCWGQLYWKTGEGHSWQAHGRLTMHLCSFMILWNTLTLTYWISCSQLSQDGTAVFLNLSGAVRCGCSFSGMCCTAHRDPDTSAFCPGQRHCSCGNLWLLQPTTFSVQNTWFLTVRTKHDGKEVLNQQACLHVVSHLTLVILKSFRWDLLEQKWWINLITR